MVFIPKPKTHTKLLLPCATPPKRLTKPPNIVYDLPTHSPHPIRVHASGASETNSPAGDVLSMNESEQDAKGRCALAEFAFRTEREFRGQFRKSARVCGAVVRKLRLSEWRRWKDLRRKSICTDVVHVYYG